MTCAYWVFLVHGEELQAPIPDMTIIQKISQTSRLRKLLIDIVSVAHVRPRTSKGITDLLLLNLVRLDAASPSKKNFQRNKGRWNYLAGQSLVRYRN